MDENPYQSPSTSEESDRASRSIQYRTFSSKSFSFRLSTQDLHDDIRRQVQLEIDGEIGAENVVSIAEHTSGTGSISVTVWYRQR